MALRALDEMIIIETFAKKKGDEIFTESGLSLGYLEQSEIAQTGIIISVGSKVPSNGDYEVGSTVIVPHGRISNVPDPRVVDGSIGNDVPRQLMVTHWKNISVVY